MAQRPATQAESRSTGGSAADGARVRLQNVLAAAERSRELA